MARLDVYLVDKSLFSTRSKAQDAIKSSLVLVNDKVVSKCGFMVEEDDIVDVLALEKYVSRSGIKLEQALKAFKLNVEGLVCLDIGASTGGFTDCLIQNGASFVYALDVGTNQLATKLKEHERIYDREGVNCRYLTSSDFDKSIDLVVMDVSFISATKMFEAISNVITKNKATVILLKPQFEVGSVNLNKHGMVKREDISIKSVVECCGIAEVYNLQLQDIVPTELKGKTGNQEYLTYFIKDGKKVEFDIKSKLRG